MRQTSEQLATAIADIPALEAAVSAAATEADEALKRAKAAAELNRSAEKSEKQAAKAFADSDKVRQKVEKLQVHLKAAEGEIAGAREHRADLESRIERIEAELAELPGLKKEAASLEGAGDNLQAASRLKEEQEALAALNAQIEVSPDQSSAAKAIAELEKNAGSRRTAADDLAQARAHANKELAALEASELRVQRASVADPSEPCPTCGRELGEGFDAYVRHCKQEAAAAKKLAVQASKVLKESEAVLKKADTALAKAEKSAAVASGAQQKRATLATQFDETKSRVTALLAMFGKSVPDAGELRAMVERAKAVGERIAQLEVEATRLSEAKADLAKSSARVAELGRLVSEGEKELAAVEFDSRRHALLEKEMADAAATLQETEAAQRDAEAEASRLRLNATGLEGQLKQASETAKQLEEFRAESRYLERVSILLDGFRDHLVSRVGPELSRESESLFRDLTNREYDDLKIDEETLAIKIADGEQYFDIERFSGSETDLANLALRVSISMHLSRVSGADVGMMVLDEVLGSLDAERKDLMLQVLGKLGSRFHQLFVITHSEQIKDQFPASIEIRKVSRRRSNAVLA